jgi:hypothetical protein
MLGRQPAIVLAALAAIVQGILIFVTQDVTADATWLMPILTLIAGFLTKKKTVPTEQVKDAGLSVKQIEISAKDPRIKRYEGE